MFPKVFRRLLAVFAGLYCSPSPAGKKAGPVLVKRPKAGSSETLGESAATKGSGALRSQGKPIDSGRRDQSRVSLTLPWRSGVQCGRPVRDPVRPEALGAVNPWLAGCVGIKAGAGAGPTGNLSRQPVAR